VLYLPGSVVIVVAVVEVGAATVVTATSETLADNYYSAIINILFLSDADLSAVRWV